MKNKNINTLLRGLVQNKNLLIGGVKQDIQQRYVGSIFGAFWAILYPMAQLSIYAILYVFVFRIRPDGMDEWGYVLLVFSGLIPLMAFNEILAATTNSLLSNKSLLLNTVFPAELIPIRSALAAQVPSFCGLVITLILGITLGRLEWRLIVFVPVLWILLLMFAVGIGWVLSLIALVAKDLQQLLGLITMLIVMLSPFAYTPEMVPSLLRPIIYLNPLSYFVLSFQQIICYGSIANIVPFVASFFLAIASFLIGFTFFSRIKSSFFDHV